MRRSLTIALLAGLVPLAAARAEETSAPTYELNTWNEVWKAGDVATVREENVFSATLQFEAPNPETGQVETQDQEVSQTEKLVYVRKCLAADARGKATQFLLHFTEWSRVEKGGEPDENLKGLHVEVTITDGTYAWKVLTPEAKLSDAATAWLEENYGKEKEGSDGFDLEDLGRPEAPVKVGQSWKGDPLALDFPFPLKRDESKVDLTLASVDDGAFRVLAKVRLQVSEFPLGDTGFALPFTDGGTFEGEGDMRHTLAPHAFDGGAEFKGTLKGTASKKGMATVRMSLELVGRLSQTTGGTMPPVPAPKPTEGAKPAEPAGAPK
jgi:hypothetical protein